MICSASILAAIRPISRCSIRTVVSGGETTSISGMSLRPTSEMSSGHRSPRSLNASTDPALLFRILAEDTRPTIAAVQAALSAVDSS